MGEIYALLSALSYGVGVAAIAKGAPAARGDNGVFLSIVLTLVLSALLWLVLGGEIYASSSESLVALGMGFFVAAGVFATVFGRVTNFKAIALSGAIRSSVFRRMIPVFSTILAFLILGERYAPMVLAGMILILLSVALAMWVRTPALALSAAAPPARHLRVGLFFACLSALCYAIAFIARKLGMDYLSNAALGALLSAAAGVVWYILASTISRRYRRALICVFNDAGPWQWVAALGVSIGQILLFFALISAPVAVVAIIASLEMFVAAYLAAFLFRSEPAPSPVMVLATIIASVGVGIVALGSV